MTMPLPSDVDLWSAADAQAADRATLEGVGLPSAVLMERASLCVAHVVLGRHDGVAPVVVLCGPGNNGADGFAVARILAGWGLNCHAWAVTPARNDAAQAQLAWARASGVAVHEDAAALPEVALWVDALLGTGARGPARGAVAVALEWLRGRDGPVVAVDVPSGVDVDTGAVEGIAVRADATVTFVRSKIGLHITPGRDHAGEVTVASIGVSPQPIASLTTLATVSGVAKLLGTRPALAHKGHRGHVAVVGGTGGTPGAAMLSARGALHAGAGLCSWACPGGELHTAAPFVAAFPELMVAPWTTATAAPAELADVLVVGPGLTSQEPAWLSSALARLFADDPRPAVWDASALQHIPLGVTPAGPRVLTPHPKEAAGVLSRARSSAVSAADVQAQRLDSAQSLCAATGSTVLLKGAGTVVADAQGVQICVEGTEALATAGSGDVLAGAIAAMLAAGLAADAAAIVGASVHGRAGTLAAGVGTLSIASSIAAHLPAAVQDLRSGGGTVALYPVALRG